jgi:hypothetical protein
MVIMAIAIVLTSASVAAAYITSSSSGTYALAKAGSLGGPTSLTAITVTTSTVKLTWTAPTEPSGATITSWKITQIQGSSTATSACYKTSPAPKCSVTGLAPSSTYKWKITYYVHTWTAHATSSVVSTTGIVVTPGTTIYATYGANGTSEASCGPTAVVVGGGMYDGTNTFKAAHPYYTGPVTAAILSTAVTLASTSLKFKTGGHLPFAVAANDFLLVGSGQHLDKFKVKTAAAATAASVTVETGTKLATSGTVPASSYVFDVTNTTWRPTSTGVGTAGTSYGWFTFSTLATATAYVLCVPSSKFVPTTVHATIQNVTATLKITTGMTTYGVAEASCPAGDVATSGGFYAGVVTGAAHEYFSGPSATAVLATAVTIATTTLKLKTGGLPFAVAANDYLLVGPPNNLFRFRVGTAAAAAATSVTVNSGKKLSGSATTVPAGSYVFDITSTGWRPPVGGTGTAKTTTGWYTLSDEGHTRKQSAYAICVPSAKITETTIYETTQGLTATIPKPTPATKTAGVAEVNCPVGYQPIGGGFYAGATSGAAHPYFSGPIAAGILAAKVTTTSTTLTFKSPGLPLAVAATDYLLVGSTTSLDRFKVKTAASAGATSVTVKTGKHLAGSATVPPYSYVHDITAASWRPPLSGTGLYEAPYGWYSLSTERSSATSTAYAVCAQSNPPTKIAPSITSANTTTFTVGTAGSFSVTATGYPTPTLSKTGSLPSGVTFTATTGLLHGTPATGTGGTYVITITASNGVSPNATQSFTLKVVTDTLGAPTVGTVVTYGNSSTNVVVAYPASSVANDLMFLVVSNGTNQALTFTHGGNSKGTWTKLGTKSPGPTYLFQVYYHLVTANEIPSGSQTGSIAANTITSTTLFTGTKTFVGDYITDTKGGIPAKDFITAQNNTTHTATVKSNPTNEATDVFTVTPSVNYSGKTNANGASSWTVRYRTSNGVPALASTAVTGSGAATTSFTTTKVKTTKTTATVLSFVGVDGASTLSLTTARTFTFRKSQTGQTGTPKVSTGFGLADRLVGASTTTVTGPKWKQSLSKQYAYVSAAFS